MDMLVISDGLFNKAARIKRVSEVVQHRIRKKPCQPDEDVEKSKEFLQNLQSLLFCSVNGTSRIKFFDFSTTFYTTIPHDKLKSKLHDIINQCFFHKNENRRFQHVAIRYVDTNFVRGYSDAPTNILMQM